jgi:purine-nucleoside phosphorylase
MGAYENAVAAAEFVASQTAVVPRVALVLGSGLGAWAERIENPVRVDYGEIPHFHKSTVIGHAGRLVIGTRHGVPVVAMQGRVHGYEGLAPEQVVHPLRTLWALGARTLLVTNAAGALNASYTPGDLMCIRDHINLTGANVLVGPNDDRFGTRFPDMSRAYTPALADVAHQVADARGVTLHDGVYVGVSGPSYETPAEIRGFRTLGGDAVGMSTVHEVVAASHLRMQVLGISCITNMGSGITGQPLSHAEVEEVARGMRERFMDLLDGILAAAAPQFASADA